MSAQLAFLFVICAIISTQISAKTKPKDPINFKAYLDQWKSEKGIEFKFLTRQEEIDGEIGMYKQNMPGASGKKDYILIPVGSTTSQPIIANKHRIIPLEIPLADQFGAKTPYPKMQIVKQFAENVREIRKKKFFKKDKEVPVIFIKTISWDLTPCYIKDKADFKKWCRGEAGQCPADKKGKIKTWKKKPRPQSAVKIPHVEKKPKDDANTYDKLKYVTKDDDNFYIFLPDDCTGVTLKNHNAKRFGRTYTATGKVPLMTFAWAQFMAGIEAKKAKPEEDVAVGDIGGGGNPSVFALKKNGAKYDQYEGEGDKFPATECEPKKKGANDWFACTKKKCNDPDSVDCIDASKKLARTFINNIKKRKNNLKCERCSKTDMKVKTTRVYQTGDIRAAYYKSYPVQVSRLAKLKKKLFHRSGINAHVSLNDYYNGEYNQYDDDDDYDDGDYNNEYDNEIYDEYEYEYDNEYDEHIDALYYEAVNNLLRAKDNFDVAQQIKQGNEDKTQRNGYYYYH